RQDANVVWLDSDQKAIGLMSVENPLIETSAESLAYVMYTSGSTGRPKGALIPHRAINRLVCNTDYVELGPSDVVAQVSNLAFDASTFEVWGALLNGARLEIIPNNVVLSPHSFSARLRDADVTTMFLTTALFEQLAREVTDAFGSIQNLLFGGETATPRWVRQVLETAPPKRLIHVYGPTESTTFATWQHVHIVKEGSKSIPIGRAIANTDVYILDQGLRPVPAGAVGEVFIGGEGLAQGYLNRPDLTAGRFISDPFGAGSDYRLYRTGDLARYLPDGEIDLVGRVDDQVKIRGFRVEPGEVRSALIRHPGVRDSIVLAQEDRAAGSSVAIESNKRLVAYVVGEDGFELTVTELRRFLRESVPDYMVPSAFALLDELPISANGKVDRERLPPPEPADSVSRENVVEPRDEIERRLRSLWNKTLSLSRVSVHDSFFDLGGHSLLAASLLSKINQLFDKNLTLTTLFKAPTIAQLADEIRCEGWTQPTSSVIEVQPHGSNPPFFCVASAIFICYNLAGYLGIEQPLYEVNLPPLDPRELPFTRMEAQVAQFVDDIRAVQPEGPYYIGGFSRGGVVAFEIARQLREQGHEVAILAIIDTSRPGFHGAEVRDRQTANQYTQRIDFHKIQLRQLDLKDRLTYSSALLRRMVAARVKYPMQRLTRKAAYHVARKLGRRVPERFENRWFVRHEAIWYGMGYTKQTYHGDVTLIRSGSRRGGSESAALGWDEVVDGRLEVEYVPGKHTDIFV
ncbi:MAG: amino acid adenylation domain-containing protein, partial [Chloroflexi bacterium]|nr:amino acid adenylation domain-containing protein [Chloroflexota bacterium]